MGHDPFVVQRRQKPEIVVFGYAGPNTAKETRRRVMDLANIIGELAGLDLGVNALPSYERVAKLIHKGELDVAWLPPIPYIALERSGSVVALARQHLAGRSHYHSAIIVPASATITNLARLAGLRAAWVDRFSASGFAIPRIQLAALGVNPRTAFASQRFYGTHEGVVRAVAEGEADFGATYVRLDRKGTIVYGPWSHMPRYVRSIRTLTKFGEIPSDVVAARSDLDPETAERVRDALLDLSRHPRGRTLLKDIFGADELRRPDPLAYEVLRKATRDAAADGLLDAEETIDDADILEDTQSLESTAERPVVPDRPSRRGRSRPRRG